MRGAQKIRTKSMPEPRFHINPSVGVGRYCPICGKLFNEQSSGNMSPFKYLCENNHSWGKNGLY